MACVILAATSIGVKSGASNSSALVGEQRPLRVTTLSVTADADLPLAVVDLLVAFLPTGPNPVGVRVMAGPDAYFEPVGVGRLLYHLSGRTFPGVMP